MAGSRGGVEEEEVGERGAGEGRTKSRRCAARREEAPSGETRRGGGWGPEMTRRRRETHGASTKEDSRWSKRN